MVTFSTAPPLLDSTSISNLNAINKDDECDKAAFNEPFVHTLEESKRYNASQPSDSLNKRSSSLGMHFEECIKNDLPLVSFHSPRGHNKCLDLLNGANYTQKMPRNPTALQILLGGGFSEEKQSIQTNIDTGAYGSLTLVLNKNEVENMTNLKVPAIKAKVRVLNANNQLIKTLEIFEMAPEFDGRALSESNLLACYQQAKKFFNSSLRADAYKKDWPDQLFGQFASAKGIGRSASLSVISLYEGFLSSKNPSVWPTTKPDVATEVNNIIRHAQLQNKNFAHLPDLQEKLINTCYQLTCDKKLLVDQLSVSRQLHSKPKQAITDVKATAPVLQSDITKAHLNLTNSSLAEMVELDSTGAGLVSKTIPLKPTLDSQHTSPINVIDININKAIQTEIPGFSDALENMSPNDKYNLIQNIILGVYAGDCLGSASEGFSPTNNIRKPINYPHQQDQLTRHVTRLQALEHEKEWQIQQIKSNSQLTRHEKQEQIKGIESLTPAQAMCAFPLRSMNKHLEPSFHTTDDTQQFALGLDQLLDAEDSAVNGNSLSHRYAQPFFVKQVNGNNINVHSRIVDHAGSIKTLMENEANYEWFERTLRSKADPACLNRDTAGNGALMRISYVIIGAILDPKKSVQSLFEEVLVSGQVTHPSSFAHATNIAFIKLLGDCVVLRNKPHLLEQKKKERFFLNSMHDVMQEVESKERTYGLHAGKSFCDSKQAEKLKKQPYQSYQQFEEYRKSDSATLWATPRLPHEFLKANQPSFLDVEKKAKNAIYASSVDKALEDTKDWGSLSADKTEDVKKVADLISRWNSNSYLGATLPAVVFLLEKFAYDDPANTLKMTALVTQDNDTCAAIVGAVLGALHQNAFTIDNQGDVIVNPKASTAEILFTGDQKPDTALDGVHLGDLNRGHSLKPWPRKENGELEHHVEGRFGLFDLFKKIDEKLMV